MPGSIFNQLPRALGEDITLKVLLSNLGLLALQSTALTSWSEIGSNQLLQIHVH